MIKIYCDYCQKEIEDTNEQVNLDFNHFRCAGFKGDDEYQLHAECAMRVQKKLKDFMTGKNDRPPKENDKIEVY